MNSTDHISPPEWLLNFFRWFCHADFEEDIEGDLLERFSMQVDEMGVGKAKRKFAIEIIKLLRPGLMRPFKILPNQYHPAMLQSNLKIGFRNLLKNKGYSSIKIGGFAIGVAVFLLITLFVQDELKYDQHYVHKDRIYRLLNVTTNPEFQFKKWTSFSAQIGQLLNEDYPEIEKAGRLIVRDWYLAGDNQFRKENGRQNNYEDGFAYADPEMLDILEIPMIYGTHETALAQPFSMVISKEKADIYFPNENPVGKTIILNENKDQPYTIGGVMDHVKTSHLSFDFLLTLVDVEFWKGEQTSWCCQNYDAYLRVKPGTDIPALEKKLLAIKEDYMLAHLVKTENQFAEVMRKHRTLELQSISDIYLKSAGYFDNHKHSDFKIVKLFGAIALFILLLACINFINLYTAKSANRAKEVGVRKVAGSFKGDLIRQFLTESTMYSGISVVLGAGLASYFLPYFNQLAGKTLSFPILTWWYIPSLFLLALFIGLLAGIYPAFYLSAFKPINVLKGNLSRGIKNSKLRSSMVVFQFTTSIVLVVSALVVYNQMQFILNKKIGFDKEKMMMIHGAFTLDDRTDTFKEELKRLPMVESVTNSNYFPVDGTSRDNNEFWIEGQEKTMKGVGGQAWWVAENYIPSMKINLMEGRNFSEEIAGDSAAVIINQTMADKLGLEEPLGQQIRNWRTWNIVGVVEDFHFENMKQEIRPIAMFMGRGNAAIIAARIKADDVSEAVTSITKVWDEFMPNQPIRYEFMEDSYANMYEDVQRMGNVFTTCAALAILIACLGLFGLSTFMAEQRSKEISVRKILGASTSSLFQLLTASYLKLVFISLIIGIPISWYMMQEWLTNYTYRIDIAWWVFALSGLLVAGIALLTVSRQALRLSFSNPAAFLKDE